MGLRRARAEPDTDIASRKENVGSLLHSFMFIQLSSGNIDLGVVIPSNSGNYKSRQRKIPLLGKRF